MNKDIKLKIEEYVKKEFDNLKEYDPKLDGEDCTRSSTVKDLISFIEILQKEDTNNNDLHLETRKLNNAEVKDNTEADIKNKELDVKNKMDSELRYDRLIKIGSEIAKVAVPIIFYNVWMNKGFRFEETGTYTSNTFKNLFSKFKPTE